jgi:multiple sugar transport system substrate-binding protein
MAIEHKPPFGVERRQGIVCQDSYRFAADAIALGVLRMEEAKPTEAGRGWTGRQIGILVVLLVITNLITATAVVMVAAPPPAEARALTVIGPWAGPEMEAFLPVLDAFTAKTGIETQYSIARQEDLRTILPTQFAVQRAPGDVIFMVSSFIKDIGPQGHALDVTDVISESDFNPGALDPVKVGNTIYGGVYTGKVKPGFWYRQSVFSANGWDVPTTYDEFKTLLQTIKDSGITPIVSGDGVGWPLSDVTEHFIATYGGADMHRALMDGTKSWTDADVEAVFATYLVPLLEAGYFSEPLQWDQTALNGWWNGDYALYFMGSWITGMVADADDLGVFALPPKSGVQQGIVFAGDYMFIPAYTDQPEEAKMLFQFLASAEGQTVQVQQGGHIATALGVPLSEYPAVDQRVAALMEGVDILSDLDDVVGGDFQPNFWSQLQLLWVQPDQLASVLASIESKAP